jgi:hypothetical protein
LAFNFLRSKAFLRQGIWDVITDISGRALCSYNLYSSLREIKNVKDDEINRESNTNKRQGGEEIKKAHRLLWERQTERDIRKTEI